jgi:hypothetical protein
MDLLVIKGCSTERIHHKEIINKLQNNNVISQIFGKIQQFKKRKYEGFWTQVENNVKLAYLMT